MGRLGKLWASVSSFASEEVGLSALPALKSCLLWGNSVRSEQQVILVAFGGVELGRPGMASASQHSCHSVKKEFYIYEIIH